MKITLRHIKGVAELVFDMPQPGVWVLTGLNGSGKTSLFAAIYRMRSHNAFQRFYKTGSLQDKLDAYANAEIEYEINGQTVKYRYGGQRWRAFPRKNSSLFTSSTQYKTIGYIEASGDRIEPSPNEIQTKILRDAGYEIKEFLSSVLGDKKWNRLQYVNTKRGVSSDAYLIPYQVGGKTYYFSEKNFSLGELCTLKLALKITGVPQGSLLLIDEVEMALHPQAQVRLLRKVSEIAKSKNLTVLFSTHSATIIKNCERKQIIHLRNDNNGHVVPVVGAFPAQVLGDIAFDDELTADFVFYVEDKQAKLLMEQLIGMYMNKCLPDKHYQPFYRIVPVGGFVQVVEMLNNSSTIFAGYVKRYAFLDEDVKTESLEKAKRKQNHSLLNLFSSASTNIRYLPCTPEVGVIEMFEDTVNTVQLNCMFEGHVINIANLTSAPDYVNLKKNNLRDRAKDRMNYVVNKIVSTTGIDEIQVRRTIYKNYCNLKYGTNLAALKQLLSPIFK
jgi:ABC-type lipoprotein export system ATPase subunit